MALARALGVPARAVGGYVTGQDARLTADAYHNWAEVHLDGAWQVVDPQKGRFLSHQHEYIALRLFGVGAPGLLDGAHRFSVIDERLTVRME